MSHCKSIAHLVSVLFLGGVLVSGGGQAQAQPDSLMIDPGGEAEAPVQRASSSSGKSRGGAGSADSSGNAAGRDDEELDYSRFMDADLLGDGRDKRASSVPTTHLVVAGDTLWDLSAQYFSSAWQWPKVWKLNPEIADPHWIYPGNVVRLREGAEADTALNASTSGGTNGQGNSLSMSETTTLVLRQTAYVDLKDLDRSGEISGSVDEKSLLAFGDSVYLRYEDAIPQVGSVVTVYNRGKSIKRDGEVIGAYVQIAGQLRITYAKRGKRVRAVVTRSLRVIERGMRVGALQLNFQSTKPVANAVQLDGSVVGLLGPDDLIGADAAVLLDRGSSDGVKTGNRFLVVRRGDAYQKVMRPSSNVGQDDSDYPARAIGEIMVVQAGEKVSLGIVTFSIHEFGVGDRVFMRQGK